MYQETKFAPGETFAPNGVRYAKVSDSTGRFVGIIVALALLAIGYLMFSANPGPSIPPLTSAHVNVTITGGGHGSATHIGDGLYVTAAHVTNNGPMTINGAEIKVLWANTDYDIALLSGPDTAASVPLACYTPSVGDVGKAHGNPMSFTDITTSLTVAGEAREIGDWKVALPMDGTLGPGMSGGGFVIGGALAGVNVGAAFAPAGAFPSYFGISIIVPSSVVCDLMGRT